MNQVNFWTATFDGYSMYPALKPGDTLLLKDIPIFNITTGDVVLLPYNDKFVAHRIIEIKKHKEETTIITKGDNLTRRDIPVLYNDGFLHKVVMIKRNISGNRTKVIVLKNLKFAAFLSRLNLTVGITKGRVGRFLREIHKFFFWRLRRS